MGKPLFETHRFGDRRTVVRRYMKGEQVMIRGHGDTEVDRVTVFNADCDVKVTEEFIRYGSNGLWVPVQLHTGPGDVVDANAPRETLHTGPGDVVDANAPRETLPTATVRMSWWRRFVAWFWT
jgi:hypothetical protein